MTRTALRLSRVNWFEIPVLDLDRATKFYEAIFDEKLERAIFGESEIAVLAYEKPGVGGSLTLEEGMSPSEHGVLIHLNANPSLDEVLGRVEKAGGAILVDRTALPPGMGFGSKIRDTEGNVVGLHAMA